MGNRILVIEDRQILRDLLGRADYEMIEAELARQEALPLSANGRTSY
jgi:hypothetical protein